jgi:hypothetical protein
MARRPPTDHDVNNDSSFLDVITNCVGILIILVIVVGIRAKKFPFGLTAPEDLTAERAEAIAVEQDVHRIAAQMTTVNRELEARSFERGQVNTLISAIERQLAERRAALDDQARKRYDVDRDLALAADELSRLESERRRAQSSTAPKTIEVESYPTPLGKTVYGKEAHFQLIGGRLTFIPFEALLDRLRSTMHDAARSLDSQTEVSDIIGPVGGFRLKYFMERFDSRQGSYVTVTHIEFLPASSQLGEPIDAALAAKSQLRDRLEMLSPRQYTVTIWTYPDSFAEYRKLKKELYSLGYSVAARPLLMGMPIAASPNGSKSSAQ